MRTSIAGIGLSVLALVAPRVTMAAPIPEYRAVYRVVVDENSAGFAKLSLSYDSAAEEYTLVKELGRKSELVTTLQFKLVDDKVLPLGYRTENRGCASCTVALRFNWEERRVERKERGTRLVLRLTGVSGSPGRLVQSLLTLVATLPGRRELADFDGARSAESLGTVELATVLGPVHAERHALRGATESDADSDVWLARELEDLPVRIRTTSGGSSATLELAELHGIELSAETEGASAAGTAP